MCFLISAYEAGDDFWTSRQCPNNEPRRQCCKHVVIAGGTDQVKNPITVKTSISILRPTAKPTS